MSDTPITDAAIIERRHIHKRGGSVELLELLDANVSRKLERELDQWREIARIAVASRDHNRAMWDKCAAELGEILMSDK